MNQDTSPRWWSIRAAQNKKPATYSCPLCGRNLPALKPHVLLVPEDDGSRRRHAHTKCAAKAREAGKLPTKREWRKTQPKPPSLWSRIRARL